MHLVVVVDQLRGCCWVVLVVGAHVGVAHEYFGVVFYVDFYVGQWWFDCVDVYCVWWV